MPSEEDQATAIGNLPRGHAILELYELRDRQMHRQRDILIAILSNPTGAKWKRPWTMHHNQTEIFACKSQRKPTQPNDVIHLSLINVLQSKTSNKQYTDYDHDHFVIYASNGKSGPALTGTLYRLMPSACRLIVWAYRLLPCATLCVPAAHRTEKVEKPDETVCEPRRHSCQLAFSQPFALSSTCGNFWTDFLNFKFLL